MLSKVKRKLKAKYVICHIKIKKMSISIIMSALSVTKTKDNETLTAVISGRIDTTTSPELDSEIRSSLDGIKRLVLDFTKAEYISSSGLRVLISLHKSMTAAGGELIISKPAEMVVEVFEVTGFADILNIEK